MRRLLLLALLALLAPLASPALRAQPRPSDGRPALTVAQIMQLGEELRRGLPTPLGWDERGDYFYFNWNPAGDRAANAGGSAFADSLYRVARTGSTPEKAPALLQRRGVETFDGWHPGEFVYTRDRQRKVDVRGGDVVLIDRQTGAETFLTRTSAAERGARFTPDDAAVVYRQGDNLFRHSLTSGAVVQLTDFRSGNAPAPPRPGEAQAYLDRQQQQLFGVLRDRRARATARDSSAAWQRRADAAPKTIYLGGKTLGALALDPSGRYVSYTLTPAASGPTSSTLVPAWVTESGAVENLTSRSKVGVQPFAAPELYVLDIAADTARRVDLFALPGTSDKPAFRRALGDTARARRPLFAFGPSWRPDGRYAVVEVRSYDNKTRWLARLDPATARLTPLDVQQDDAWIQGPGIGFGSTGWLSDGQTFWFQSEKTGYSHLYTVDVETGAVRPLTSGNFEVSNPRLSRDGQQWRFNSSELTPAETHLYTMPVGGGARTRVTTLAGQSSAFDDPREEMLGFAFGQANQPTEIYLARRGGAPVRVTSSTSAAFRRTRGATPRSSRCPPPMACRCPRASTGPRQA